MSLTFSGEVVAILAGLFNGGQYGLRRPKEYLMRNLRWLAVVPAALGVIFLLVALVWTEWPQMFVGVGLLVVAAIVWRVFAGVWLPTSAPKH